MVTTHVLGASGDAVDETFSETIQTQTIAQFDKEMENTKECKKQEE